MGILIGRVSVLVFAAVTALAGEPDRAVESVLPALVFGGGCGSGVELQNLGGRPVLVEIEAHRESGALVALVGRSGISVNLEPGQRSVYRPQIADLTADAWVMVRERVPPRQRTGLVAVSGATECVDGDQLATTSRDVAYPTRNPWFSGEVSEFKGGRISLTNTSEQAATAWLCYSAGGLFSVPDGTRAGAELQPICSAALRVQIPPFGARQFAVEREGATHFGLRTRGDAIVLQMLRPTSAAVKMYSVDSTVRFGSEVSGGGARQ
jgi:hypothetical protein